MTTQTSLPDDASAPIQTVSCHDCGTVLDAEAQTTHWDDSGDFAFCGPCVQDRSNEACTHGAAALRLAARIARAHQNGATTPAAALDALLQEAFAQNPGLLELAADVLEGNIVRAEPEADKN